MTTTDPALRALRAIEFVHGICPACSGTEPDHEAGCMTAAALAAAEAAPLDVERIQTGNPDAHHINVEILARVLVMVGLREPSEVDWHEWAEAIAREYAALSREDTRPTDRDADYRGPGVTP